MRVAAGGAGRAAEAEGPSTAPARRARWMLGALLVLLVTMTVFVHHDLDPAMTGAPGMSMSAQAAGAHSHTHGRDRAGAVPVDHGMQATPAGGGTARDARSGCDGGRMCTAAGIVTAPAPSGLAAATPSLTPPSKGHLPSPRALVSPAPPPAGQVLRI